MTPLESTNKFNQANGLQNYSIFVLEQLYIYFRLSLLNRRKF